MLSTMDDLLPGYNNGLVDARLHGAHSQVSSCPARVLVLGANP